MISKLRPLLVGTLLLLTSPVYGQQPNREYIRLGNRVVAVENPNPHTPTIVSMAVSPTSGTSSTITITVSDPGGYANISKIDLLMNLYLDGQSACYVAVLPSSASSGSLHLVDDQGDNGFAPGSP